MKYPRISSEIGWWCGGGGVAPPAPPLSLSDVKRVFWILLFYVRYSLLHLPPLSDSTVSEDAGIEPRTAKTLALTARRSDHSARSHPQSTRSHPQLGYRSHPQSRVDIINSRYISSTDRYLGTKLTVFSSTSDISVMTPTYSA